MSQDRYRFKHLGSSRVDHYGIEKVPAPPTPPQKGGDTEWQFIGIAIGVFILCCLLANLFS